VSSHSVVGLGPDGTRERVLVHEVLDPGAQAVVLGAAQVLDRGAKADARAATR
jgi:hypothetical protein